MKHYLRFIAMLSALLMILMSSVSAQNDTIALIVTRDPSTFDPQVTRSPSAIAVLDYLYDTLVYQAADGSILPSLAEDWVVSEDGTEVTFSLKDGITFSDGSVLDAEAVAFSVERFKEVGERSLIYGDMLNIESVEVLDPLTAKFVLIEPASTLLSSLSFSFAGILSPSAVEAAGEDYAMNPVGTGPYVLAEYIPESELTLTPNPNYAGHRPWVETDAPPAANLRIRFSRDEAARANALMAGEAEISNFSNGTQVALFEGNPDFTVLQTPGRGLVYVGFNNLRAPFDNPVVRKAIAQAIDKDMMVLLAADGLGTPVNTLLPPSIFGYNEELDTAGANYDPDAARETLEAELDAPLELTILTSTFPTFQAVATVLQEQLAGIGVTANVEILDFSAASALAAEGEFDIFVTQYDWNDPDVLSRYLESSNIGDTNRYFYSNEAMDALLQAGRTTFDPDTRQAIYNQVLELVQEEVPIIPLYMPIRAVVVSNRVSNVSLLNAHVVLDAATLED